MARLVDVNGNVSILNDADQVVATFDLASGLPLVKIDTQTSRTPIPTADPHIKGKPWLSSGVLTYSKG